VDLPLSACGRPRLAGRALPGGGQFLGQVADTHRFKFLIRDQDSKFNTAFDNVFSGNRSRVIKTPVQSPPAKSFAEPLMERISHERLDHTLILGERHLPGPSREWGRG
jgi:hypothetical protein